MGQGSAFSRKRLGSAPLAPLKIASGCDPSLHLLCYPTISRRLSLSTSTEILEEAKWLAENGVSESSW